jgi:uncharacterized cupin superfamily protein
MDQILVEHNPSPLKLDVIGVFDWPVWTKDVSRFAWRYDQKETCYLLEGEAIVTPDSGAPVRISASDLVTFPAGLSCTWEILAPVKKHYHLG